MNALDRVEISGGFAILVVCVPVGILLVFNPVAALGLTSGLAVLGIIGVRREKSWLDLLLAGFACALALGYGFANIGFRAESLAFPIPLSAVFLLVMLGRAVATAQWEDRVPPPVILVLPLLSLALVRLWVDYPNWGTAAIRDFTLPLESAWLFVGYQMMRVFGVRRLIRGLRWVFLALLAYSALRPWYPQLAQAGPTVGLQSSVPLLGHVAGLGSAAAAGLFFFALVRPTRASYVLAAAFVPTIALDQFRGVYLAVLAAFLVSWLISRRFRAARPTRGLVGALTLGVLGLAVLFPFAPQGRVSRVTPTNVASQIGTLVGQEWEGASGLGLRMEWVRDVVDEVRSHDYGLLVGVGLGPDLAGGFRSEFSPVFVRKPHNDYLEVFGRLGIPGLALFLTLVGVPLMRIARATRRARDSEARYLMWALAMSIGYLVVAATQPILAYPSGTMPLFIGLGSGLALAEKFTHTSGDSAPRRPAQSKGLRA